MLCVCSGEPCAWLLRPGTRGGHLCGLLHVGRTHGTPLSAAHPEDSRGKLVLVPWGVVQHLVTK